MLYYPFSPDAESLIDTFFNSVKEPRTVKSLPLEVIDGNTYYKVKALASGVDPENLEINVEGKKVTISGEVKAGSQLEENESVMVNEIKYGKVVRELMFDTFIDSEKVKAELQEGVLEIYLPKTQPKSGKTIKITQNKSKES